MANRAPHVTCIGVRRQWPLISLLISVVSVWGTPGAESVRVPDPRVQAVSDWARHAGNTILVASERSMAELVAVGPGRSPDLSAWLTMLATHTTCAVSERGEVVAVSDARPVPRPMTEVWYEPGTGQVQQSDLTWWNARDATDLLADLLLSLSSSAIVDAFRDGRPVRLEGALAAEDGIWARLLAGLAAGGASKLGQAARDPTAGLAGFPRVDIRALPWTHRRYLRSYTALARSQTAGSQDRPRPGPPLEGSARLAVQTPFGGSLRQLVTMLGEACRAELHCDRRIADTPVWVMGRGDPTIRDMVDSLLATVPAAQLRSLGKLAHFGLDLRTFHVGQAAATLSNAQGYQRRWRLAFYDASALRRRVSPLQLPEALQVGGVCITLLAPEFLCEWTLLPAQDAMGVHTSDTEAGTGNTEGGM